MCLLFGKVVIDIVFLHFFHKVLSVLMHLFIASAVFPTGFFETVIGETQTMTGFPWAYFLEITFKIF